MATDERDPAYVAGYEQAVEDAENALLEADAGPEGQDAADTVSQLSFRARGNAPFFMDDDQLRRITADLGYTWRQCENEKITRARKTLVAQAVANGGL